MCGFGGIEFLLSHILQRGCLTEEDVVELDDVALRTVVGIEGAGLYLLAVELLFDIVEQSPVARTPTVDALLYVAHNEVRGVLVAHGLGEEHTEILPLYGAGILKLIDHDMFELGADLLEDKG